MSLSTSHDTPSSFSLTFDYQVYITGNALAILSDYNTLQQTIYDDDETPLEAVAFDETTGWIATCTNRVVRVYQPHSISENSFRVGRTPSTISDMRLIYVYLRINIFEANVVSTVSVDSPMLIHPQCTSSDQRSQRWHHRKQLAPDLVVGCF